MDMGRSVKGVYKRRSRGLTPPPSKPPASGCLGGISVLWYNSSVQSACSVSMTSSGQICHLERSLVRASMTQTTRHPRIPVIAWRVLV